MNPHQDFIDARSAYIAQAVVVSRAKGLRDEEILVVLGDAQAERDTWPAPPPEEIIDAAPPSVRGVSCVALPLKVAQRVLKSADKVLLRSPRPGTVRVMAFHEGSIFFTHARVLREP